ncbi:serine/threonine protein kinase [Tolypothrix sp. NIES-4075]|uniref:serine/threonine-protein kinase n=1 Tax=Tolypothrix sp. NIES-4075 TaxID=2005459 RepID=UPI000B5C5E84|nr:serine/threonine-protein kinase [Tolypothrix sp. NIES-4075]GAX41996.1 serine/threonine protein kinase [Tolypothrix sp. NIES-4075]
MCDCPPYIDKSRQSPKKDSVSGFRNTLLNERYRILRPLGQGGFGKTFLAVDEKCRSYPTPRLCVIKQFFPQSQIDYNQKAFELFHQESLRLAELGKHPQIPELLDIFEQDGQQYLVQEWIDGQNLEQELKEAGAFYEAEILLLLRELLPVLAFVHKHNCIHRDIKPANIIRRKSDRQLVLVDFGAAKCTTDGILEKTGTLIGSAEYASPEQIRGKAVFASDLYSLGVTCLRLLTQMSPFDLHDCSEDNWVWRSYLSEPIGTSLEQILDKLLQRATKLRYQSAAEVLRDLNDLPKHSKHLVGQSKSMKSDGNNDDFETYFGCSQKENLPASITVYSAALDIHLIAAITVFDPKTQAWYYLPPKISARQIAQKAATYLSPRLGASDRTLVEPDKTSLEMSLQILSTITQKVSKISEFLLTAIATILIGYLSVAAVGSQVRVPSASNNQKIENLRIFPNIFRTERK